MGLGGYRNVAPINEMKPIGPFGLGLIFFAFSMLYSSKMLAPTSVEITLPPKNPQKFWKRPWLESGYKQCKKSPMTQLFLANYLNVY